MEAVASQPPVVPGVSADVTPVAGGASMTALPSAMKELARFFLNLSGSSSLGASGDSAGVTASGAVLGDLACPSSSASGAAPICGTAAPPAGAGVLPDASDALPSVSGEHRRRVRSRSRGRRSRSSSDRTDRRAKKRSRRGSPSPERSSRRREKRYRSSSESSEDRELPLLLLELGVRMEVRVLVDPPGIMAVLGHMQGWIQTSLGRVVARLVLREWLRTTVRLPSSR